MCGALWSAAPPLAIPVRLDPGRPLARGGSAWSIAPADVPSLFSARSAQNGNRDGHVAAPGGAPPVQRRERQCSPADAAVRPVPAGAGRQLRAAAQARTVAGGLGGGGGAGDWRNSFVRNAGSSRAGIGSRPCFAILRVPLGSLVGGWVKSFVRFCSSWQGGRVRFASLRVPSWVRSCAPAEIVCAIPCWALGFVRRFRVTSAAGSFRRPRACGGGGRAGAVRASETCGV
jgi:hypothetical protein